MQFSSEFLVATGVAVFLALAAIAIGLRPMKSSTKKGLEILCWAGAACGLLIALLNLPKPTPKHTGFLTSYSTTRPVVEIGGGSRSMLNFGSGIPNLPVWEVAQNQNIKFEVYDGKVTITTKVLDKDGKILVQIEHNHWTTPEVPQILDWNYADDALEVIGPSGRVVLQIKVLGDRFQIAGEWWDENGRGQRWVKVPYGAEMLILVRTNDPDEPHIVPLFQYPSTRHLGKLVRTQNNDPPSYVQVMLIFIAVYALGVFSCPIALFALWLQER